MTEINGIKAATLTEVVDATEGEFEAIEVLCATRQLQPEMTEGVHYFRPDPNSVKILLTKKGVELITEKGVFQAYAIDLTKSLRLFE